jgi:UDP-3-O-acyl-N-acetylglucosamine deacetylase
MMKSQITISFLFLTLISCSTKNEIVDLEGKEKLMIEDLQEISLVKSFMNTEKSNDSTLSVNAHLCLITISVHEQDSILVFEPYSENPYEFSNVYPNAVFKENISKYKGHFIKTTMPRELIKNKRFIIAKPSIWDDCRN